MPNGYPPPGLETETDAELNAISRPALESALAANLAKRGQAAGPGTLAQDEPTEASLAVRWGWLQERHDDWAGQHWQECRALYAGGQRLLGNKGVMERLFPKNLYEAPDVYAQRQARAHYYPYAGSIIDQLLAGLGTAPLRLQFGKRDEKDGTYPGDEWWDAFSADVTREGESPDDDGEGERQEDDDGGCSMHHFAVDVLREAMQTEWCWILCDLPRPEEDEAGEGLEPYLCIVPAEQVIDWEEDDKGELEWVLTCETRRKRAGLRSKRGVVTYTYTLWTAEDWVRYVIEFDPKNPPHDDTAYAPADRGDHPFGRVPLHRFRLPEGLFAMGKLHNLAREHFNKRCAMSWAEYKSLYPILYEFQGAEDKGALPTPGAQTDPERGVSQIRGQGYSQIRGADDDARFIGPDPAPFKEARESCNDAMREMHRVMFSMAQSANMDSKALSRSGDSKEQDVAATQVLLEALGRLVRKLVRALLSLVALGKGDAVPPVQLAGLDTFDVQGVAAAITQAVELLNGVPMLSQTFKSMYLTSLYVKILGGDLTPAQIAEIRKEIEEAATAEQALMEQGIVPGAAGPVGPGGKPPADDEAPDEDFRDADDDEDIPPAKPKAKGGRRTMIATGRR